MNLTVPRFLYTPILVICIGASFFLPPAAATDSRAANQSYEAQKKALIQKAQAEKKQARKEADEQAQKIRADKTRLKQAVADLKQKVLTLDQVNGKLEADIRALTLESETLTQELSEAGAQTREFLGMVRSHAKDLQALLLGSLQSGIKPDRHLFLAPLIHDQDSPAMADVKRIADQLFEEIDLSGQVQVVRGPMVDRNGLEQTAELMLLGNFTGIYTLGNEVGFLLYSDKSQRYFALSRLPSSRVTDTVRDYLAGRSEAVYTDVAKGAAVRALAHQLDLMEQVPKGGAIVWPILGILALAVLILLERTLFFLRRQTNEDKLMRRVSAFALDGEWEGCRVFLESKGKRLVPKVLLKALALREKSRPEIENALQEAILGEIPSVERFLSTLGMLAAIAPLLGLLGTVTGMINTFHVITYYGTGDPRMMSGGISEALVTTMLGLSVAIPVMLAHTLLNRKVETQILKMEEKSVAFVNLIFKNTTDTNQSA